MSTSRTPRTRYDLRSRQRYDYTDLFRREGKLIAPNSCIDSAEWIIQRIARAQRGDTQSDIKYLKHYEQGKTERPYVMARFAKEEVKTEKTKEQVAAGLKRLRDVKVTDDEVIINITKKRKLQDAGGELRALGIGLKDYDFQKKLPKAGQGLILLNKTEMDSRDLGDREYNMHLGAVVAYQPGMPATISDMSATEALPALEMMETREIKSVQEFRGGEEYPAGFFAMGLLEAEADT